MILFISRRIVTLAQLWLQACGNILNTHVFKDQMGRGKGYGLVCFDTAEVRHFMRPLPSDQLTGTVDKHCCVHSPSCLPLVSSQAAQAAINQFHTYQLEGRPLAVSLDRKLLDQVAQGG